MRVSTKSKCATPTSIASDWDCTLEPATDANDARRAVRLGLRLVAGAPEKVTTQIVTARANGYGDLPSLWVRSGVPVSLVERLADADAFRSIGLDRRPALWAVRGLDGGALQAGRQTGNRLESGIDDTRRHGDLFDEPDVKLPETTLGEHVVHDYASIALS